MEIQTGDQLGQKKWNEFVIANSQDAGFLQSWQWGEFNSIKNSELRINNLFRIAVVDSDDDVLVVAQIIKKPLPLGQSYFYIPRGPVLRLENEETPNPNFQITKKIRYRKDILDFLFNQMKLLAKKEGALFIRFDPAWPVETGHPPSIIYGETSAPSLQNTFLVGQVQPWQTLILDISKSEDELVSQMKPKTRYNIKVAQKHCIKIDEGEKYIEDFIRLTRQTSERDQFVSHPDNYYRRMLSALSVDGIMKLFVALYDGQVVAANLVVFFGQWCVYLHGASNYQYRDKMAPYLLQWEIIQLAKSQGKKYYDFWGVGEGKLSGVTRFKQGFAPDRQFTTYAGCFDLPVNRIMYFMYRLAKGKN